MDIEKKKTFISKRRALKGDKIYLHEDLSPTPIAQKFFTMAELKFFDMLEAQGRCKND